MMLLFRYNNRVNRRHIGLAWIGALLLCVPFATCFANDEAIIQKIDKEVSDINAHLYQGHLIQLRSACGQYSWCEFETAFVDKQGHIRKIIEWAEGTREGGAGGAPSGPKLNAVIRSVWETYYDVAGKPIFLGGRYEGRPGSGYLQEHTAYLDGDREIAAFEADGHITPFNSGPPGYGQSVVGAARKKLQEAAKKLKNTQPATSP